MRLSKYNYKTQDPLYYQDIIAHHTGGYHTLITKMKDTKTFLLPKRNICWLLYQMAREKYYDPEFIGNLETAYNHYTSTKITPRHAFGALYSYYYLNQGSVEGIKYWEETMEDNLDGVHLRDITDLVVAMNVNHQLHRDHFREKLTNVWKPIILKLWKKQAEFHDRRVLTLAKEFNELQWYDEDVWNKIFKTVLSKKYMQNLHFFQEHIDIWKEVNETAISYPTNPFTGQLDDKINQMKIYWDNSPDYQWRYNWEEKRFRTYEELKAMRNRAKREDFTIRETKVDKAAELRKLEEAKKQKRLQLAKYNEDLFLEVVDEYIKSGKTMLEMMIELDCEEQELVEAKEKLHAMTIKSSMEGK